MLAFNLLKLGLKVQYFFKELFFCYLYCALLFHCWSLLHLCSYFGFGVFSPSIWWRFINDGVLVIKILKTILDFCKVSIRFIGTKKYSVFIVALLILTFL